MRNCLSLLLHVAISIIFMCKSSVPLNAFRLKEDCKGINSLGIKVVRFGKGWWSNFISYVKVNLLRVLNFWEKNYPMNLMNKNWFNFLI